MSAILGSPAAMQMQPALDLPDDLLDDEPLTEEVALEDAQDEFERDGFALAQGLACMVADGEKLAGYASSLRLDDIDPSEMTAGALLAVVLAPVDNLIRGICACELRERLVRAARDEIKWRAAEMLKEAA